MPRHAVRRTGGWVTQGDYETLADLRYHIRRFLRLREEAARTRGIEPQQYMLLLQVKGLERRRPATIGTLAERLQVRHHSVVQLVDRAVRQGMVRRQSAPGDGRGVVVALTPRGEEALRSLAAYSVTELRRAGPELATAVVRLIRGRGARARHAAGADGAAKASTA